MGSKEVPPQSLVFDIYGCMVINSFSVMSHEHHDVGVGLYLAASAIDHSCHPNAEVTFDGRYKK